MKSLTRAIVAHLGLYRPDAAAISLLSYIVGVLLGGGRVGWPDVGLALLVSLVSTNFIYTVNSITDRHDDRLAHPRRPLPSGRVTVASARAYAMALFAVSVVYPFLVARSRFSLALFLLLPVLGVLYSVQPVRLRRRPWIAVVIISTGLVTPLTLGAAMTDPSVSILPVSCALFMFCLASVPFKAFEEMGEDAATGRPNLAVEHGRGLFAWSTTLLVGMVAWTWWMVDGPMRWFLTTVAISVAACALFSLTWTNRHRLYQTIIRIVILEGVVFALILWFS